MVNISAELENVPLSIDILNSIQLLVEIHVHFSKWDHLKPDTWKPHNTKSEHRKSGSNKKTSNKFSHVRIYHTHKYLPCFQSPMKI